MDIMEAPMHATATTRFDYVKSQITHTLEMAMDFLYGDDAKTRRTLALCALAMATAFILQTASPMMCSL